MLEKKIAKGQIAILDNARNQSHEAVQKALQRIFAGLYAYLPTYTPEFAPVERVIHLVKEHIILNVGDLAISELQLLKNALDHYSTDGPGSEHCAALFDMYGQNHEVWSQRIRDAQEAL